MNDKYSPAFTIAYVILVLALLCAGTVFAVSVLIKPKTDVVYRGQAPPIRISNKSKPNMVQKSFAGKPLNTFGQSDLGLPTDGTCYDY